MTAAEIVEALCEAERRRCDCVEDEYDALVAHRDAIKAALVDYIDNTREEFPWTFSQLEEACRGN